MAGTAPPMKALFMLTASVCSTPLLAAVLLVAASLPAAAQPCVNPQQLIAFPPPPLLSTPWGLPADANGISADGSLVVGYAVIDGSDRAALWHSSGSVRYLDVLPGGLNSYAFAASGDGSVVVGFSNGHPDGLLTGDDFNAFISAFAAGCP